VVDFAKGAVTMRQSEKDRSRIKVRFGGFTVNRQEKKNLWAMLGLIWTVKPQRHVLCLQRNTCNSQKRLFGI